MLSRGEIYDYRDVGHLSDRRLSMGEENAVAIIGMQRAAAPRMWVSGQRKEVSIPSVMNAVFDNPKLISKTIFRSWFKRLGLKIVVHAYNTRNAWIQLPSEGSVFDARFLEPEAGTCWEVLVKTDVMAEVRKLITGRKDAPKGMATPFKPLAEYKQNPPEGDVVTGRHSILGSPEGHQDLETGNGATAQSGCLQAATPAQSPYNVAAEGRRTVGVPFKKITTPEEATANNREADLSDRSQTQAASPGLPVAFITEEVWERAADPTTIVEDLDNIDRLLDEAEQMSQVGYQDDTDSTWEGDPEPPAEPPKPDLTVRRVQVPPEVRGWEEDD